MKYYIAENGQPAGPFEPNELMAHGLTVNSLVWAEGMASWTSASQVPELMAVLSGGTINVGPVGMDTQLPQMPPMGDTTSQLPQVPPFGGQQQTPSQPYGQGNQQQSPLPFPQQTQPTFPQQTPTNTTRTGNQVMPKTWLTECIVVTVLSALCCCNPVGLFTGIYSIIKANSSKTKYMRGDATGSAADGATAKKWMIITIVIGLVWSCIQAYRIISDPSLLQQIQEGTMGSLYGL